MVDLIDLIEIYDNNLDNNLCETLIETFELHSSGNIFNLTDNRDISGDISEIHQNLIKTVIELKDLYYEKCYMEIFPESHAFEKFIITKYDSNVEAGPITKTDVKSYDEARRFLCFKWFLNNNNGGQINFLDLSIQPEQGRLIVYPPLWMFPYREEPSVDVPKYVLTTYLHYK